MNQGPTSPLFPVTGPKKKRKKTSGPEVFFLLEKEKPPDTLRLCSPVEDHSFFLFKHKEKKESVVEVKKKIQGVMAASSTGKARAARCGNCNRTDLPLKRCENCRATSYCNMECQKADWPVHKTLCAGSGASTSRIPVTVVMGSVPAEDVAGRFLVTAHASELDNVATGVPMAWSNAVMFADDGSDAKREAFTRFVLYQPIVTDALADCLVGLVRETCVNHAFDTRGTVDPATGWVVSESKKWDMKASFNDKLCAIVDEIAGDGVTDSYKCDMRAESRSIVEGLMFKRTKGPRHPRTVLHNGRNFVFLFYNNNSAGTWFEVSLKCCTMCCHVCRNFDANACGGCGKAYYCSRDCQRKDWDTGHKTACVRKPES